MNIDELNISDVSYHKSIHWEHSFILSFSIDGFRYELHTSEKKNSIVYPSTVFHERNSDDCTYCKEGWIECQGLKKHLLELFHALIEHPSIRLEWLYLSHV